VVIARRKYAMPRLVSRTRKQRLRSKLARERDVDSVPIDEPRHRRGNDGGCLHVVHGMADTGFSSDVQQSKCRCALMLVNGHIDVVDWSGKRYAFGL